MANPLYLTAEEKKLFEKLPRGLTKDFTVVREERKFEDSEEKVAARQKSVTFESSSLRGLKDRLAFVEPGSDLAAVLRDTDPSDVSEDEMSDLLFAMGPERLSAVIEYMLSSAKSQEDVRDIANLTEARSAVLTAFTPSSVS